MARDVEIGYSYRGIYALACGALALGGLSGWVIAAGMLPAGNPALLAVAAIGLFYGAFGVFLIRQRQRAAAPVVTLTPSGFKDIRLTQAPIPWPAIRAIRTKTDERTLVRCLVLWIDPAAAEAAIPTLLARQVHPSSRTLGLDRLYVDTGGLTAGHAELERMVRAYARAY